MSELRVNTVFVPVTDIEASRTWYERTLGLEVVADWGAYLDMRFPGGSAERSGLTLHRVERVVPAEHSAFNLHTSDPAGLRQRLAQQGVRVGDLQELGEYLYFDVTDPDGNELSIVGPGGRG